MDLFLSLFESLGFISYLQLFLGFLGIFVIIRKFLAPRVNRKELSQFLLGLGNLLEKKSYTEALQNCQMRKKDSFYRISSILLERNHLGRSELEHLAFSSVEREEPLFEKGLFFLFSIVIICPLLGLFGSILAMLELFLPLSKSGDYLPPQILSQSLFSGLMTSAIGLAIAIPFYIAYLFFLSRAKRFIQILRDSSLELVHIICDSHSS